MQGYSTPTYLPTINIEQSIYSNFLFDCGERSSAGARRVTMVRLREHGHGWGASWITILLLLLLLTFATTASCAPLDLLEVAKAASERKANEYRSDDW